MGGTETMNKTQQAIDGESRRLGDVARGVPSIRGRCRSEDRQLHLRPAVLTVKAGTTVTWVNGDDIPHVVAEKDGKFRSGALDTDDSFSQSFATAETVEYFCAIHPHMTGKIIVTP